MSRKSTDSDPEVFAEWDRLTFPQRYPISEDRRKGIRELYARCYVGGKWVVSVSDAELVTGSLSGNPH
ncbi:MAG TPA: hypothetical protein VG944_03460 [Fimbriimonas sp.]|nr:hypothetical protein [Fimbriimonas sp.]